ncbi:MAG: lipopolysaccharide biosynthesis protein [Bacteroidota bacterium]
MFQQLKRLLSDTAIYGVSTIIGRLLNFLLVPLYTHILAPAEYGIVATVYSFIAFYTIAYSYGLESAYFRFAGMKEIGDEKENFSTPFISYIFTSTILSALLIIFAARATVLFQLDVSMSRICYYVAGILFFDTLALLPFAALRLHRNAKLFSAIKVVNIVLNLGLSIITLVQWKWGIEGILFSNLAASVVTFALLVPSALKYFRLTFRRDLYKEMMKFAIPLIPVALSGMALQIADRPILKMLVDDRSVGIYQANYRLGIFMAVITATFEYAWRPFFLSHAKDPNAKQMFSRVMTYYLFITLTVFLVLVFFLDAFIKHKFYGVTIISSEYWEGLNVVPFVLLAYIFSGIGTNLNAGIQIEKKTMYLLPTSLSGSISNVALNFILVPMFGIMGAAYATTIGYAMVALTLYFVAQRFYYIEYEFSRIAKLIGTVIIAFAAAQMVGENVGLRLVVLLVWFVSLFAVGFFTREEMDRVRKLLVKKT